MDSDKVAIQNLEGALNIAPGVDVTNSINLKETTTMKRQQCDNMTSLEGNNSNNSEEAAVVFNKTEENNTRTDDNNLDDPKSSISTATLGAQSVASQSLRDILASCSSSSSSSVDSEADSVDLIQDLKSSDSSESDWEEIPSSNNEHVNNVRNYRDSRCASSGNTSDSNESLDDDVEAGAIGVVKPIPKKDLRTDEDLELDDLPPVPDLSTLSLNVKTEDCIQMGKVSNIIDRLVTIDSLPNTPAYDIDTLLFLDEGKLPLGYVYDVIGQVTSPIYVIRFNSKEEIQSKGITRGMPVYCAPNTEHTQFVFLKELLKMRGSDASWQGDHEVPIEFVDYSDDELEFSGCKQQNNTNERITHGRRKRRHSLEKHKLFETTMNLKNEVNSARYKMRDVIDAPVARNVPRKTLKFQYHHPPPCHVRPPIGQGFNTFAAPNFTMPPNFNIVNMPPHMFNVHVPQYPMMHFPPNPQFPPPTFGSPAIPPLPHMPHVTSQPPPPPPGYLPMLPIAVCNPIAQIPKILQNTGVVPKIRPRKYTAPADYQYSGPQRESNPYVNNARQNHPPSSLGSQPYGPSPYNIPFSNSNGGTQYKKS